MIRIENALAELREIVTGRSHVDEVRCRRLLLRATSAIPDLNLAATLGDRAGLMIVTLDMVEALGDDRAHHVERIMDTLNEIERASRPQ